MSNDDLIRRIDAIQSCQVGPSDEWSLATKDGYNQAATDIAMNMLRIHSVQPDQVAVRVKPLVWKWHRDPKDTSEARTQIGSWTIWEINGSAYCYGPDDTCGKPCVGGLEGAKAAAQADYEARILAAIEPAQTAPTTVDASQTSQVIDNARAEGWAAGIEAAAQIIDAKHRQLMISKGRNPDDYDYPESQLATASRAIAEGGE